MAKEINSPAAQGAGEVKGRAQTGPIENKGEAEVQGPEAQQVDKAPDRYLGQGPSPAAPEPALTTGQVDTGGRDSQLKLLSSVAVGVQQAKDSASSQRGEPSLDALGLSQVYTQGFRTEIDLASIGVAGRRGATSVLEGSAFQSGSRASQDLGQLRQQLWGDGLRAYANQVDPRCQDDGASGPALVRVTL